MKMTPLARKIVLLSSRNSTENLPTVKRLTFPSQLHKTTKVEINIYITDIINLTHYRIRNKYLYFSEYPQAVNGDDVKMVYFMNGGHPMEVSCQKFYTFEYDLTKIWNSLVSPIRSKELVNNLFSILRHLTL